MIHGASPYWYFFEVEVKLLRGHRLSSAAPLHAGEVTSPGW